MLLVVLTFDQGKCVIVIARWEKRDGESDLRRKLNWNGMRTSKNTMKGIPPIALKPLHSPQSYHLNTSSRPRTRQQKINRFTRKIMKWDDKTRVWMDGAESMQGPTDLGIQMCRAERHVISSRVEKDASFEFLQL